MNNEELILQMLGKISDKLEEHDKHFESIDNRFESIDNRFESLETDVRHTRFPSCSILFLRAVCPYGKSIRGTASAVSNPVS